MVLKPGIRVPRVTGPGSQVIFSSPIFFSLFGVFKYAYEHIPCVIFEYTAMYSNYDGFT